jgi:opacity protein-like surface antigen
VGVEYDFRPNIKVTAGIAYAIDDYKKAPGAVGVPSRSDDYFAFEIGVRYLPTENFFIGPSYRFTDRNSNISGNDFSRHIIALRVGARL